MKPKASIRSSENLMVSRGPWVSAHKRPCIKARWADSRRSACTSLLLEEEILWREKEIWREERGDYEVRKKVGGRQRFTERWRERDYGGKGRQRVRSDPLHLHDGLASFLHEASSRLGHPVWLRMNRGGMR